MPTQEPGNGPCVGFGKDKNGAPARAKRKRVLWGEETQGSGAGLAAGGNERSGLCVDELGRKGETMFRYKKGIPLSYSRQGYIYFTSRNYKRLTEEQKAAIRELCRKAGGQHERALFEFVATDATATAVCQRHYIGESTLRRMVQRYYMSFPETL